MFAFNPGPSSQFTLVAADGGITRRTCVTDQAGIGSGGGIISQCRACAASYSNQTRYHQRGTKRRTRPYPRNLQYVLTFSPFIHCYPRSRLVFFRSAGIPRVRLYHCIWFLVFLGLCLSRFVENNPRQVA